MKKLLMATAVLAGLATHAVAADRLTLQLKWVADAQFAGYYVAQAKGFYKAADLDVAISRAAPTSTRAR